MYKILAVLCLGFSSMSVNAEEGGAVSDGASAPTSARIFRVGPTVMLGIPHPLSGGLDAKLYDFMSFGASYGYFKFSLQGIALKMTDWDARVRWHPGRGSFFLGVMGGQQTLSLTTGKTIFNQSLTAEMVSRENFVTPHLGWFSVWDSGFTMGFELGVQIPFGAKTNLNISGADPMLMAALENHPDFISAKDQVSQIGNLIGKQILPYITLLRLGWLF